MYGFVLEVIEFYIKFQFNYMRWWEVTWMEGHIQLQVYYSFEWEKKGVSFPSVRTISFMAFAYTRKVVVNQSYALTICTLTILTSQTSRFYKFIWRWLYNSAEVHHYWWTANGEQVELHFIVNIDYQSAVKDGICIDLQII